MAGGLLLYEGLHWSHLAPAALAWLLLMQTLALGGGLRHDEAYPWLWAFLAVESASLLASAGQVALPHLLGTVLVGAAWLLVGTPRAVGTASVAAWGIAAAWAAWGPFGYFDPAPQPLPGVPFAPRPLVMAVIWAVAVAALPWVPFPAAALAVAALAHAPESPGVLPVAVGAGFAAVALAGARRRVTAVALAFGAVVVLAPVALVILHYPAADPSAPPDSSRALDRWQQAALARMPEGSVQPAAVVAGAFPSGARRRGRLYRLAFPAVPSQRARRCEPAWLAVSNNVESVTDAMYPPSGRVVLFRSPLPARPGRVFASHFNTSLQPRPLVLEFRNPDPVHSARVRWGRRGLFAQQPGSPEDPGAEAWRRYLASRAGGSVDLAPGAFQRVRLEGLAGNGVAMLDLEPERPLELTVAMGALPEGRLTDPALPPVGGQSRGLYPCPDEDVEVEFELASGRMGTYTFGEEWLEGLDASGSLRRDVLKGNYGALSHLRVRVRRDPSGEFRRLLVLLVPSGGFLGTAWEDGLRILHTHDALVVHNREVPEESEFRYDFTLAANAFAPAYVLLVPLRE